MIIDAISDLHGHYPKLSGGDLLIVAGDLTKSDEDAEYLAFFRWLDQQDYDKKILISGNHDNQAISQFYFDDDIEYLLDCGTEYEGLRIWGSPWTPLFKGVNPRCKAFMLPEEELEAKFALIPDDIDILVTHGPPFSWLDHVARDEKLVCVGSKALLRAMDRLSRNNLKAHIFGHIHEGRGLEGRCYNVSHVDEYYIPVNGPMRIIL